MLMQHEILFVKQYEQGQWWSINLAIYSLQKLSCLLKKFSSDMNDHDAVVSVQVK